MICSAAVTGHSRHHWLLDVTHRVCDRLVERHPDAPLREAGGGGAYGSTRLLVDRAYRRLEIGRCESGPRQGANVLTRAEKDQGPLWLVLCQRQLCQSLKDRPVHEHVGGGIQPKYATPARPGLLEIAAGEGDLCQAAEHGHLVETVAELLEDPKAFFDLGAALVPFAKEECHVPRVVEGPGENRPTAVLPQSRHAIADHDQQVGTRAIGHGLRQRNVSDR